MPAKKPYRENMPLYLFITLLTFFSACGLLGGDDDKEPLEPGPRNYEWSVDTLENGPGVFYDIWGASPDNVWAVSSGGLHTIWHFDGTNWKPYEKNHITSVAETVYGFSKDDIWIGGGEKHLPF